MTPLTIADALTAATTGLQAGGIGDADARTEASILLCHTLGVRREELRLRPDRLLSGEEAERFFADVTRRADTREPLAYITGEREFYGLRFLVSPAVLVPRPETEFLVEAALVHLRQGGMSSAPRIVDVGTGSGCVAVAIAKHAPLGARVWATELSQDAAAVARENVQRNDADAVVTIAEGDLLAPVTIFAPFDVVVSNPPYIAPLEIETLAPEVRDWEPRIALGENADALHFYRRLARETPPLLAPGGLLAVEVGQNQAESVAGLWRDAGLAHVHVINDYARIGRIVAGTKPA